MARKTFGIILIVLGSFILLSQVMNAPNILREIAILFNGSSDAGAIGHALGYLLPSALFTLIGAWMISSGIKRTKTKPPADESSS